MSAAGQQGGPEQDEEDVSLAFLNTMEDTVVEVRVEQGIPFVGRSGKQHPIYIVCLRGNKNERTRSFRFNTFREYHEGEVIPSPLKTKNKFPKTFAKSFMGLPMSTKEIEARCRSLDAYMREIFSRRAEWTPRLKNATLSLLKLDDENVFPTKRPPPSRAPPQGAAKPKSKAESKAGSPPPQKAPVAAAGEPASHKKPANAAPGTAPGTTPSAVPAPSASAGTSVVVQVEAGSYAHVHKHRLDCAGHSSNADSISSTALLKTFAIEIPGTEDSFSARMTFTPRWISRGRRTSSRKAPRRVLQVLSSTSEGDISILRASQYVQNGPPQSAADAHVNMHTDTRSPVSSSSSSGGSTGNSGSSSGINEETSKSTKASKRKSVSFKTAKFPDGFHEALENGIKLVKFNRKGIAAFRIISMADSSSAENTVLNWRPAEKEGFSAKLLRLGKSEGIDLKNLKAVRPGESPDPESAGKWGTATLRTYAQKSEHGTAMLQAGITFCLIFNERSLDFGADSVAQRDFLVSGFEALMLRAQGASVDSPKAVADEDE